MPVTTGTWYATSAARRPGTPLSTLQRQRLAGQPAGGEHVLDRRVDGGRGLIDDCHYFFFLCAGALAGGCRLGQISLGELGRIVEAAALEQRTEAIGQRVERHAHHLHPVVAAARHEVDLAELDLLVEVIEPPLRAAALAPLDRARGRSPRRSPACW